ncbi:PIN domain-containing protein [Nocardia cyriacigeorgica]|uniref:Ribonuclease VapC n=1 Tax=Nocardia cyriacigeorgica TaxID=135487 RepID=A0A5R8PGD0_9NOCA|nr:PIN domain-containing protein [Nocardia cyriacigeorgica]
MPRDHGRVPPRSRNRGGDRRHSADRVSQLLCDTGVLIALYDRSDSYHARCVRFMQRRSGTLLVPEPVLGEACNFLRNHLRSGPALEIQLLEAFTATGADTEIVNPTPEDRKRATELARQLVTGPLGYVDAIILATAERLKVTDIASVDFKFLGMAGPVSRIQPLNWVLQEFG